LLVQRLQFLAQPLEQLAHHPRQSVLAVFQNFGQPLGDVPDALGDHDPELGEQPPDLVRLRRACLYEPR
jgi:hypothetical protein